MYIFIYISHTIPNDIVLFFASSITIYLSLIRKYQCIFTSFGISNFVLSG